jgi:hypothetical protein
MSWDETIGQDIRNRLYSEYETTGLTISILKVWKTKDM